MYTKKLLKLKIYNSVLQTLKWGTLIIQRNCYPQLWVFAIQVKLDFKMGICDLYTTLDFESPIYQRFKCSG